jgi:hypothetical protein
VLTNLSGLASLQTVGHDLDITGNDSLCESLASTSIASVQVAGLVNIYGNTGVCP